jgi:hypothetical protein
VRGSTIRRLTVCVVDRDKRLGEDLAHQIRRQLGAGNPHPQKTKDIASPCSVKQAERFGIARARAPEEVTIADMQSRAHGR